MALLHTSPAPPAMVRDTVHVLTRSGLPRDLIHYDDVLLAGGERAR
jgi:hypothetical protein